MRPCCVIYLLKRPRRAPCAGSRLSRLALVATPSALWIVYRCFPRLHLMPPPSLRRYSGGEASVAPRSQTTSQSANTGYTNHFPRALSTAALSIPARDILVSKTGTSNLLEEEPSTYHDLRERLEPMDQRALYELCRTEINQPFTRLYAIRGTRLGLTGKGRESPERRHQGHEPSNVVRVKERRDTAKRGEQHDPARPLAASLVLPGLCGSASRELTNCTAMAAPRLLPVTSTLSGDAHESGASPMQCAQ